MDFKEDTRSLRDFYPEPQARCQMHYHFAHRFVPWYVQQNPYAFSCVFRPDIDGGVLDATRYIQSRWQMFESMLAPESQKLSPLDALVFRRVADLSMSLHVKENWAIALIHMPAPEQSPLAYFVAIAFVTSMAASQSAPQEMRARILTLERKLGDRPTPGVICEWTKEGDHCNAGVTAEPSPEAFLEEVVKLLERPQRPRVAGVSAPLQDDLGTSNSPVPAAQPTPTKARPWWRFWQ